MNYIILYIAQWALDPLLRQALQRLGPLGNKGQVLMRFVRLDLKQVTPRRYFFPMRKKMGKAYAFCTS